MSDKFERNRGSEALVATTLAAALFLLVSAPVIANVSAQTPYFVVVQKAVGAAEVPNRAAKGDRLDLRQNLAQN